MAIDLTSIGVKCLWAVETTAGTATPPTTGFKHIPGIKEIPEMNPAPDTLETSSLDNTEYKTYTSGLKDLGGALEFTAGLTQELYNAWMGEDGVMETYNTNAAAGKRLWMCIVIPGLDKANYFTFEPSPIGVPGMAVNEVLDVTLSITPTGEPIWAVKPTDLDTLNFSY